jgi:hypothetical protein
MVQHLIILRTARDCFPLLGKRWSRLGAGSRHPGFAAAFTSSGPHWQSAAFI